MDCGDSAGSATHITTGFYTSGWHAVTEMKAKSKLHNGAGFNAEFVARGEIELAIQQISEIIPVQGVELVGPLPGDLQLTTVFATGIGTGTKEQAAAKEFIKFLTSSAAAAVIKATGMEPEGP
jgi:ABC-type molybdate transport system substrate-binding protein